jgi:hypothetical protein
LPFDTPRISSLNYLIKIVFHILPQSAGPSTVAGASTSRPEDPSSPCYPKRP